ncbi:DUF2442 domain-containing protein [Roseovarius salinarum]|uniref:DUF2442 domain-containing protein n=1 Tax=Roseovarius salinarum TaxID=1981892 RepID=UPI000C3355FB|nr:DUF2442 domain-containing protein [Roseovarius salinarum]
MSVHATSVRFDDDTMWVYPSDGRILGVSLAWFPRLLNATTEQRVAVTISAYGLHWAALGEDISVPALLAGEGGAHVAA